MEDQSFKSQLIQAAEKRRKDRKTFGIYVSASLYREFREAIGSKQTSLVLEKLMQLAIKELREAA